MKRGAEFQLTKTNVVDGEDSEDSNNTGQGFHKAPEDVLASRKIKPLPSRTGSNAKLSPFGAPTPVNPSFMGSTVSPGLSPGFTSIPTTSTNPFSFKPVDKDATSTPSSISFNPSSPFSVSSTPIATNTSKAFASILNSSSTDLFSNPAFNTSSNSKVTNGTTESSMTTYYKNLRGLNLSLLNFIKSTIEGDPFFDVIGALESYKTHRSRIQKEYDESTEKTKTISTSVPIFGKFGTTSTPTIPSTPVPSLASNPGNAFTSVNPATFTAPSTNIFGTSAPSPGTIKPANSDKASTSKETFSVLNSSQPGLKPTTSPFSFGSSLSSSSNPFAPPSTNLFGSVTSSSSVFGTSDTSKDKKPATSIAFGSPSIVAKNTGVFYGFGSGAHTTSEAATQISSDTEKGDQETSNEDTVVATGSERTGTKGPLLGLHTPNPYEEEGAGEENEDTVYAVKLKAYRMRKADEQDDSKWAELGMGILRLKRDKDSDARRMLLRNSINGKININFKIYSGLKPSISKKALTFVGHSDGVAQTYCVRLPNEEQANELKAALEREIEFVKAKESS